MCVVCGCGDIAKMTRRLIGVILFDSITTFHEFEVIIRGLLEKGFQLEIAERDEGSWQLIITKKDKEA